MGSTRWSECMCSPAQIIIVTQETLLRRHSHPQANSKQLINLEPSVTGMWFIVCDASAVVQAMLFAHSKCIRLHT